MGDVRARVAVYVIQESASGPELMVFEHRDHPDAGTQVPAGGVEPAEGIEQAAQRGVREETGVSPVTVVGELGVQRRRHPHIGQARTTTFCLATTTDPRSGWSHEIPDGAGGDAGMTFTCRFMPASDAVGRLADAQDEFLTQVLDRGGAGQREVFQERP